MVIKGGYYIKARCIQDSEIAHAPPHVREIWDWLLKEANHKTTKKHGQEYKRGEVLCTYDDIRDALHWMIGWRKKMYPKHHCETTMKWLKKREMVTTRKTTRGMIVTVCNYEYYQNPKNYETDKGKSSKPTVEPQTTDTINKNEKNDNNVKKKYCKDLPNWMPERAWIDFIKMRIKIKSPLTDKAITLLISKLEKLQKEGNDVEAVLNESIMNSWKGVFPLKKGKSNGPTEDYSQYD